MKKWIKRGGYCVLVLLCTLMLGITVQAKTDATIKKGIYADGIELSGLTTEEATQVIEVSVEQLKSIDVTLLGAQER